MKKIKSLIQLMRPAHWIKNMFVLAPLVFGFKLTSLAAVKAAFTGAILFCLVASILYIVNDLTDHKADSNHLLKRKRPIAAGHVSWREALFLATGLSIIAAAIAVFIPLPAPFYVFLGVYIALSTAYNFGIKHVALLELFIVASGYVLRVLAGCAIIHELPSPWILAATGTVALLITAGKRRAEIAENNDPQKLRRSLDRYNLAYLDSLITMLAAVTVVTYLLFTTSDYATARFHTPYFVLTSIFVLYGVARYLQLVKVMGDTGDPTTLVLTDRALRYTVLAWIVVCSGLIYL